MQISGLIAESEALYALESMKTEPTVKYQPTTGLKLQLI